MENKDNKQVTPPVVPPAPVEPKKDEIDYAAELEKAKEQLKKAEYTIVKLKDKKEEKPEDDDEPPAPPVVDIEKIKEEAKNEAKAEIDKFKLDIVTDTVEDVISKATTNPKEAELIRHHYQHSIVRSGYSRADIAKDIARAKLIANEARLAAERAELIKAAGSNDTKVPPPVSGEQDIVPPTQLTAQEEAFVKQQAKLRGVSEDVVRKKLIENKKLS